MTCRPSLRFAIAFPILILAACATTAGKVSDGNYYAPNGNFVLPVDRGNVKVQDRLVDRGGLVSVVDDMGNNYGVTYLLLPSTSADLHGDPAKLDAELSSFVHDYALTSLYRPASPQSKVDHEEFLGTGPDRALFAVATLPGTSSVMDGKTGKRWDSIRSLLVFDKNGYVYMLHSEMNTVFGPIGAAGPTSKDLELAHKAMRRLRESIHFQ
jgi:hypothetical protein